MINIKYNLNGVFPIHEFSKSLSIILFFLCALAGVSLLLATGCGSDNESVSGFRVFQIGELDSVIADGLASQLNLVPYEGQSNGPIIMQGDTIFSLSDEEEEGIQATFEAGFSIALLDADQAAVDDLQIITDNGLILTHTSESDPILLAYIVRKEEGIFTDRVITNPLSLDPPEGDSALITAENIVIDDLMLLPNPTKDEFESEGGVNVANVSVHQHTISIPQENFGAFNTTVNFYSYHECFSTGMTGEGFVCAENPTFLDEYIVTAEANWTPGTQIQSSDKTKTEKNVKTVTQWFNNDQFCFGSGVEPNPDAAKTGTACRVMDYPRFYALEMSPLLASSKKKGTISQKTAVPSASQGETMSYTSGFILSIGGGINISGDGPDAGFQIGASWNNETRTTVPPLKINAGNLANQGAFWEFVYAPEILEVKNKKRGASDCNRLMSKPQQGQTTTGKFSNAVQTVRWQSCPEVRDDVPLILKISGSGKFGGPEGIAAKGDIYVVDSNNSNIQIYFRNGNLFRKFGSPGTGDGQFNQPFGIAVDRGRGADIFVADTGNNRIQVFNPDGFFRLKFGSEGTGDGQFNQPSDIAVDSSAKNIYVVDQGNNRIQVFDNKGNFLFKFGSEGTGDGQFNQPFGIAVDRSANILVADTGNNRVQVFDNKGNFLFKFGSEGTGDGQFNQPFGIAVDRSANIYVADTGNNRIQVFDNIGKFIFKLGSEGTGDGQFDSPFDVAVDIFDEFWVADAGNNRVQGFNPAVGLNVKISFEAALADSSLRVWCTQNCGGGIIGPPAGGDCNSNILLSFMCACNVRTTLKDISESFTYTIPFPSLKCTNSSCFPEGFACVDNIDCCSGTCRGSKCTNSSCFPEGFACVDNIDCCSATCRGNGTCASGNPP